MGTKSTNNQTNNNEMGDEPTKSRFYLLTSQGVPSNFKNWWMLQDGEQGIVVGYFNPKYTIGQIARFVEEGLPK